MNAHELARSLLDAKAEIDAALLEWREAIEADAIADDESRRAKARAYVTMKESHPKATVGLLDSLVDLETADAQRRARHAEGLKRSAAGAFDAKKAWLSALQSLASLSRSEAQLATWTPREVESA